LRVPTITNVSAMPNLPMTIPIRNISLVPR
jgi:hypothetical protein